MPNPLNFEPRESSPLYFYAAHASAAGVRTDHDPQWPGQSAEQIEVTEPDCAAYRKHMARAHKEAFGEPVEVVAKKAPRVPRDTEPCHLHVMLAMMVFLLTCIALLGGSAIHGAGKLLGVVAPYVDAFLIELVRWIGGVL